VVRYSYSPGVGPSFVPSSITNFWLSEGREIELDEWKLLELRTSNASMTAAAFDIQPFLERYPWEVRVYTNDAFYIRATNGALVFEQAFPTFKPVSPWHRLVGRRLFYVPWIALNFAIFLLMVRMKAKQQIRNEERTQKYEVQT